MHVYQADIRGRKFYHHRNLKLYGEKSLVTADEDNKLVFKVYYKNITKKELSQLLWVTNLGCSPTVENNEKSDFHCHKIGKAKPLGYGRIKNPVRPNRKVERNFKISKIDKFFINIRVHI